MVKRFVFWPTKGMRDESDIPPLWSVQQDLVLKSDYAALEAQCRELEAALKLVACNCNGEAGCKSYELYYKLCPASETKGGESG